MESSCDWNTPCIGLDISSVEFCLKEVLAGEDLTRIDYKCHCGKDFNMSVWTNIESNDQAAGILLEILKPLEW